MMSQNNLTDLYVESSVPCVPIVPVLGEIVEICFDTVGNVLYAWVTERGSNDLWSLCYASRVYGYELLFVFESVGKDRLLEGMQIHREHVTDVAFVVDGSDIVAVTEEFGRKRVVKVVRLDPVTGKWRVVHLLQFDLDSGDDWVSSAFDNCVVLT